MNAINIDKVNIRAKKGCETGIIALNPTGLISGFVTFLERWRKSSTFKFIMKASIDLKSKVSV